MITNSRACVRAQERLDRRIENAARRADHILVRHKMRVDLQKLRRFAEFVTSDEVWARAPLTRSAVAVHEAAHFAAFEIGDLEPNFAEICGRGGWSGTAFFTKSWCADEDDADGIFAELVATLAGPIAEEIFVGGGVAAGPIWPDLFEAAVLARRAAELLCEPQRALLREAVADAARLVERNGAEIVQLAELLERRKRIFSHHRPVSRLLARLKAGDARQALSAEGAACALRVERAVTRFARELAELIL